MAGFAGSRACPERAKASRGSARPAVRQQSTPQPPASADFIVVGSGAGGGTVAARLVEAGYSVLVLEAGGDPRSVDYDVPAFHPFATENESMRWDFFVHHYSNPDTRRSDPSYIADKGGVWYPRAGTLGGCTSHNAMIFVHPSNHDWNQIAGHQRRPVVAREQHAVLLREARRLRASEDRPYPPQAGVNPSRHGYDGWLSTEKAAPAEAISDRNIRRLFASSIRNVLKEVGLPTKARLESFGDPNDWRVVSENEFGACYTPMTTRNFQRVGARERLMEYASAIPIC